MTQQANERTAGEILEDMDVTDWERFGIVMDALTALSDLFRACEAGSFEDVRDSFGGNISALLELIADRLRGSLAEQSALWTELAGALRETDQAA